MLPPVFGKIDMIFVTLFGILLAAVAALFVWLVVASTGNGNLYRLTEYEGPGNGVLKHGTILSEEYQGPESVLGHLNINGIWILEKK